MSTVRSKILEIYFFLFAGFINVNIVVCFDILNQINELSDHTNRPTLQRGLFATAELLVEYKFNTEDVNILF